MSKLSKIITAVLLTAAISQAALASEIPIESAPCNATIESITITEQLIGEELTAVQNGEGFQPALASANRKIREAVIVEQTGGYGYAALANIACNALLQCRDIYLRPDYYNEQNEKVYELISDLILDVQNGKPYSEALNEAYTRILKTIDPSYEPSGGIGTDKIYIDVPATDTVMFSRTRMFLLEAIPYN